MFRTLLAPFALVAILLAGCGRSDRDDGTIKLTFWHIMNYEGPREVLAAAVKRFEAAHPGVKVEVQVFANDAYKQKLESEMRSNTPPDVMFTWGGGTLAEYARAGRVVKLDQALSKDGWRSRFIEQALGICSTDEGTYAVPLDLSVVPLWYNRELLAQHGVAPPKTFAELLAACRTLKAAGVTPLSLGNSKIWPGAFYFVYLATRGGGAQLFLDAAAGKANASLDDPAFVTAGKNLQRMIDARVFSNGFNGLEEAIAQSRFLNGEAAMYLMGTWLVAQAKGQQPEFLEKLACIPFPSLEGGKGDPTTVVGGVNCGFAVSSTCKHPDLAIDLLRYLTAEEVAAEWCKKGRIPALKMTEEQLAELPAPTRQAQALLAKAARLQPYYDQYLPPRLAEEHKKTTQGIFAGTVTPQEAADRMARMAAKER